jgi:hypothetical protein
MASKAARASAQASSVNATRATPRARAFTAGAGLLRRDGYVDVLASVGNREPTHPWSASYYSSMRWAVIDHVLVRNGRPVSGDVLDFGLWAITDETDRIEANLRLTGSDHFPVVSALGW